MMTEAERPLRGADARLNLETSYRLCQTLLVQNMDVRSFDGRLRQR